MLTADAIRGYELRKGAMGGYRADEVEDLREEVALTVEQLTAQNQESLAKIGVLAQKIEEYRHDEASIHEALLKAQKMGDALLRDAKKDAAKCVSDAEKKASEIINSAQFKADSTISEAEAVAAELSADAKQKAETLLTNASLDSEEMLRDAKAKAESQLADADDKSNRMLAAAQDSVDRQQALFDHIKGEIAAFRSHILSLYFEQIEKVEQFPGEVSSNPRSLADIIAEQPAPAPGFFPVPEPAAFAPATEQAEEAAAPVEFAAEFSAEIAAEPAVETAPGGSLAGSGEVETAFGGVTGPAAQPEPEPAPAMGGFRIMVDDEDDEDERQATLTFGDEETTQGFVFKK